MNKLGFYVENTTIPFLRDAFVKVRPPVLLIHAGDRGLLREIRNTLSPDTFVIARLFVDLGQQHNMLNGGDPEGAGRSLAERIVNYDFGLAKEKGNNGRLLIDAWMSLNEPVPGPASFVDWKPDPTTLARYDALDRLQTTFLERLRADGLEGVAFNFAAGNFAAKDHVVAHFPRSLAAYTYLGFHEYGWPTMMPQPGSSTGVMLYRPLMEGIRERHGNKHKVIITESGLARMYRYPQEPAGDVGWLYRGETISEQQYWESLEWYNGQMAQDDYVMGACLYQVGHSGQWESFRHLGADNDGRPILLMDKIAALRDTTTTPDPKPPKPADPPSDQQAALQKRIDAAQASMQGGVAQADAFTRDLQAAEAALNSAAQALAAAPAANDVGQLLSRLDALAAAAAALPPGAGFDAASLNAQIAALRQQAQSLLAAIEVLDRTRGSVAAAQARVGAMRGQEPGVATTRQALTGVLDAANGLEADVAAAGGAAAPREMIALEALMTPTVQDVSADLTQTAKGEYPLRPLEDLRRIVIHHTGMRANASPEDVARRLISEGRPGIPFHYLVTGDGSTYRTQPLEARTNQSRVAAVDADGVAVAFGGDFDMAAPTDAQMEAGADLLAGLLTDLGLPVNAIYGRSELERGTSSPGMQWSQGVLWRDELLARVAQRLPGRSAI